MNAHARQIDPGPVGEVHDPVKDDEVFIAEVRAFLEANLTSAMRDAGRQTIGYYSDLTLGMEWFRCLSRRGWIAPSWPKDRGGTGWTLRQRYLFDREVVRAEAPVLFASGIRSIGPLLIEQGTPAQQARYIPAMLNGTDLWCQGFSEPQAGSDLAAIQCRAVRDEHHYVINGSKIWTTGAHDANRMFAIFRSSDTGKKQEGMTFLLIDMDSPGLKVVPILGLNGEHEFNQVFFDDVRVPVANRIGAEGDGWTVAKRLMALARSNNTPSALVRRLFQSACKRLTELGQDADPALRLRLAGLGIELDAYEQMELAALPGGRPAANALIVPSVLKTVGSELHQRLSDLLREMAGPWAMITLDASLAQGGEMARDGYATAKYLSLRAASIYSGSSETQRNVMAKALLAD